MSSIEIREHPKGLTKQFLCWCTVAFWIFTDAKLYTEPPPKCQLFLLPLCSPYESNGWKGHTNTEYFSPGSPCISAPEQCLNSAVNRSDSPDHWLLSAGSYVSVVLSPACHCHARLHLDAPHKYWFQPSLAQLAAENADVTQKASDRQRRAQCWLKHNVSAIWYYDMIETKLWKQESISERKGERYQRGNADMPVFISITYPHYLCINLTSLSHIHINASMSFFISLLPFSPLWKLALRR